MIAAQAGRIERFIIEDSLEELKQLTVSAGASISGSIIVKIDKPNPATYLGSGKINELALECKEKGANILIFDDDLSPAQVENIENGTGIKAIDRTELILDIFAQHAHTSEGKLQIEMAQLSYLYPRLAGRWTHLSRQEGGIGIRGPGEKQLEIDRRRVREKIARLKKDLKDVQRQRRDQRKKRKRSEIPSLSIVGYTNSGKSTLMNTLTGTDIYIADELFATLDPTTRKITLPSEKSFFISDTVGFIKKLPHQLVESFKTTLDEVKEADILIMVIDISTDKAYDEKNAVEAVLEEIGTADKPVIYVLNKIDLVVNSYIIDRFKKEYPESIPMSAKFRNGVIDLLKKIDQSIDHSSGTVILAIPDSEAHKIHDIYENNDVLSSRHDRGKTYIKAKLRSRPSDSINKYIQKDN